MIRAAAAAAVLVGMIGCEKQPDPMRDEIPEQYAQLAEKMCACRDVACATKVEAELTAWSAAQQPIGRPTRQQFDRIAKTTKRLDDCQETLKTTPIAVDARGEVTVEQLVANVRAWATANGHTDLEITEIFAQYIHASGVVDPKYGKVAIALGLPDRPVTVDDPDRPTGAPVAAPAPAPAPAGEPRASCPTFTWSHDSWAKAEHRCDKRPPILGPRCTVDAIWKRALADRAPADAVAVLRLGGPYDPARGWQFVISDRLRKVDVRAFYPDDCMPKLERTGAPQAPGTSL